MDVERDQKMLEIFLEAALAAVNEQYILPLTLALSTVTAACTADKEMAAQVADALRKQAASCPDHVAGRVILQSLARLADAPTPSTPDDVQHALRNRLRLIQGSREG